MSLFSKVVRCMRTIAPLELADTTWDNVGILVEPPFPATHSNKVFLTIDLTLQVLDEALSDPSIGAIVAYHPPIFRAMKRLTQDDPKQSMVTKAIARGIGIYSPHTACDNCVDGVNDWLASGLGKGNVQTIIPAQNPPEGQEQAGTGRVFTYDTPTPISTVIENVKKHIGLPYLRVAEASKDHVIQTVAICAGSGSSVLNPVKADLFLTGEMGHHDVLAAVAQGTSVILCEHSNTERGYLSAVLKDKLESMLKQDGIQVVVSQVDKDPLVIQ